MRLSQRLRSAIGTLFAFCLTAAPGVEIYIAPLPAESGEFDPIWVELELRNKLAEPTIVDLGAKRKEDVLISVSTDRGEIRSVPVDTTGCCSEAGNAQQSPSAIGAARSQVGAVVGRATWHPAIMGAQFMPRSVLLLRISAAHGGIGQVVHQTPA